MKDFEGHAIKFPGSIYISREELLKFTRRLSVKFRGLPSCKNQKFNF